MGIETTDSPEQPVVRVRGAHVLAPDDLGKRDVVLADGRILAILDPEAPFDLPSRELTEIDGAGRTLTPALVDIHCHPVGGGGWGGPETHCEPIDPADFVRAGIGTMVGCLGYDTTARRPEGLLGRVRTLRALGFGAHMYTGEIAWPPATITGELSRDVALIPEVRGVKGAIADHDGGITSVGRLVHTVSEAKRGARTAGKPPVVHLHVGQAGQRFEVIQDALAQDLIDPAVLTLTHVNWSRELAEAAVEMGRIGVNLDLTACIRPDYFPGTITAAEAIAILLDGGVAAERITVTSDSGGSHREAESGRIVGHRPGLMLEVMKETIASGTLEPAAAVALFTRNPAARIGLSQVGRIATGVKADLVLFGEDFGDGRMFLGGRRQTEVVG
ncbi:MAG TPA: amidohydrolase family protein [Solirubrobacterales bacterium]|nr:amidohydrolase family protein [Solirubrobacterales bacterium]